MLSKILIGGCLILSLHGMTSAAAAQTTKQSTKTDYSACGPQKEKHSVIKNSLQLMPAPAADKALIYFFWRGSSFRSWAGVQTKLAIDGKFVAALSKNTYTYVEISPGVQRLCASGSNRRASPKSVLVITAEAGKTYYFEGEPGGDLVGTLRTTLTQVSEEEGKMAIQKSEYVTFTVKK